MKKVMMTVEIEFQDNIYIDEELNEVSDKVLNALIHAVDNGNGLAPEASETFTVGINIRNSYNDYSTSHKYQLKI